MFFGNWIGFCFAVASDSTWSTGIQVNVGGLHVFTSLEGRDIIVFLESVSVRQLFFRFHLLPYHTPPVSPADTQAGWAAYFLPGCSLFSKPGTSRGVHLLSSPPPQGYPVHDLAAICSQLGSSMGSYNFVFKGELFCFLIHGKELEC